MFNQRKKTWFPALLVLALLLGCVQPPITPSGQPAPPSSPPVSPERVLFNALKTAAKLYDLGMTTGATLRDTKVITPDQYGQIKAIGQKFYDSWLVAEKAAQNWATMKPGPEKDNAYAEVERLMTVYTDNLTDLTNLVSSFQKKKGGS